MKIDPILNPAALAALSAGNNLVLIDARSGPGARADYETAHLTGAFHVDLDQDLARKPVDPAHGGRHPLPDPARFSVLLGQLGITPTRHVVVYDNKNGANAAARFWWMLKALGHEKVQVLDGGYQAAAAAGVPVSNAVSQPTSAEAYPVADGWQRPMADISQVEQATAPGSGQLVIDVREGFRFRGESEPIDLVAGHIPGAVNAPYTGNLEQSGRFLPAEELEKKYRALLGDRAPEKVIVHCGSGVTACHTLLALEQAGLTGAQLYVGSWSEWSRTDRPIATGE